MNKSFVSGMVLDEEHVLEVNKLVTKVSDLKWDYYTKYHQEPRFIKMPIWVYVLLERFTRQLVGFSFETTEDKTVPTYMGLQICDTMSINEIEDIEVF